MKKLITILLVSFLAINTTFAQTEQGTILLEGSSNLNFSSLKVNSISLDGDELDDDLLPEDGTNTLGFKVTGGYFMMDGLAVGLLLDYSSSSTGDAKSNSLTIGPIVRYHIGESGMWAQLSYGMGSGKSNGGGEDEDDVDSPKTSALGIGVGYAIMLSDNVSLSPSLGYAMNKSTVEVGDVDLVIKSGGIVFSCGIAVYLGN